MRVCFDLKKTFGSIWKKCLKCNLKQTLSRKESGEYAPPTPVECRCKTKAAYNSSLFIHGILQPLKHLTCNLSTFFDFNFPSVNKAKNLVFTIEFTFQLKFPLHRIRMYSGLNLIQVLTRNGFHKRRKFNTIHL